MGPERILIVGCGPGSPEHLTGAARAAAEGADWVLGPPRLQALFPGARGRRVETAPGPVESLAALGSCDGTAA
ncbi:MAG: SAM-dependent methyltransferase, partial [Deferrisomatales bacterium]